MNTNETIRTYMQVLDRLGCTTDICSPQLDKVRRAYSRDITLQEYRKELRYAIGDNYIRQAGLDRQFDARAFYIEVVNNILTDLDEAVGYMLREEKRMARDRREQEAEEDGDND